MTVWKIAMLAVSLLAAAGVPPCTAADVKPGVVLDQSSADDAKDLLPPEIHSHYKKGEYTNRIVDFPHGTIASHFKKVSIDDHHLTVQILKRP